MLSGWRIARRGRRACRAAPCRCAARKTRVPAAAVVPVPRRPRRRRSTARAPRPASTSSIEFLWLGDRSVFDEGLRHAVAIIARLSEHRTTRRRLLQQAGTLVLGGLAATAFGAAGPQAAATRRRDWRGSLSRDVDAELPADSSEPETRHRRRARAGRGGGQAWAGQDGSTVFTDYRAMIEKTKPEFVVALGHHAAMPAECGFLSRRAFRF